MHSLETIIALNERAANEACCSSRSYAIERYGSMAAPMVDSCRLSNRDSIHMDRMNRPSADHTVLYYSAVIAMAALVFLAIWIRSLTF